MNDRTSGEGKPLYFVERSGAWVHHDTVLGRHVLTHPDDMTPFGLAEASAIADIMGGVVYHYGSPVPGARACSVCGRPIYLPQLAPETPERCHDCNGSAADWEASLRRLGHLVRECRTMDEAKATATALNAALSPDEKLAIERAGARRVEEMRRARDEPLPTLEQCIEAGTHMIGCTGDGYCKVCFDRDGTEQLYVVKLR